MTDRILVTGGSGFLGSVICDDLIAKGYRVSSFSRRADASLIAKGVTCYQGDLSSLDDLKKAVEGHDAIIHVGAKAGVWGPAEDYYKANVLGTQHVIDAALLCGVKKIIYTSSASVVFDATDMEGLSEAQCPYPQMFYTVYPKTKMEAEKLVLAANGRHGLATVSIRPHLIWGPGDPHFLPRVLEASRKNRIRKVGHQKNLVDVIHVKNASHAHILALEQLALDHPMAGKAYFIGQDQPVNLWWFIDQLLLSLGEPAAKKTVSFKTAYCVGAAAEALFSFLPTSKEPPITRFVALQMGKSHFFSHKAAQRDFGYRPILSTEDGLKGL